MKFIVGRKEFDELKVKHDLALKELEDVKRRLNILENHPVIKEVLGLLDDIKE